MSFAPPIDPVAQSVAAPAVDFGSVTDRMATYLKAEVENAKNQTSDLHNRCRELKELTQNNTNPPSGVDQSSLEFEIRTREAADQRDDMSGLLSDMIIRTGALFRVEPGDDETPERSRVVQSAMEWELSHTESLNETERGIMCYTTYPFAGMEAFRDYKDGYSCYGIRNINPHCFAVSDAGRPCKRQFSVHKLHFFTKREMRKAGFENLDKLGKPDGNGDNKIMADGSVVQRTESNRSDQTYRIWESWVAPPFMDWATEEGFRALSPEALVAWILNWKLQLGYFADQSETGEYMLLDSANFLKVYHHDGIQLRVVPNCLLAKNELPQRTTSFHPPTDDSFANESFIERAADSYEAQEHLINAWWQNMVMVGNQSMFVSTRASVPLNELEKIYKPRGICYFSGNEPPDQLFVPYKPQSIANDIMPGIQFFQSKIEQGGVNDVMRGMSRARTATANQNDNIRGQMQVNKSGALFVREVILPCLKDLRDMIVANYTPEDWIRVCGEDGALMATNMPMTDRLTIDKHFRILPVASFEYLNQQARIAELTNILNVAGPLVPIDMSQRIVKVVLDNTRLDRTQVEYIEGNAGSYTDILEEIEAMKADPFVNITVNPTDDHRAALIAVMQVVQGDPMIGEPPMPQFMQFPSVQKYWKQHQMGLQAQIQMEQMMASQGAGPQGNGQKPPKGNPKQIPSGGVPQEPMAMVRSMGQQFSPPDNMTNPGMTGRGSPIG